MIYDVLDDPNWTTNILNEIFELHEEIEEVNQDTNPMDGIEKTIVNNTSDLQMPGHCRSELWACLSSLLETGIRHVQKPEDLFR